MKKIALDLDGVVFDSENLYRVHTEIWDVDKHHKDTVIDNAQKLFQKRYNWSENEFDQFYGENSEYILRNSNLMPGADVVINKLIGNFEFIVVTSRDDFETEIAMEAFKKIGLGNIQIFCNEHHKIDRLKVEQVDYLIDDDGEICSRAADCGIIALYFKNNAANKLDKKGVININNWGEIYKFFKLNDKNF